MLSCGFFYTLFFMNTEKKTEHTANRQKKLFTKWKVFVTSIKEKKTKRKNSFVFIVDTNPIGNQCLKKIRSKQLSLKRKSEVGKQLKFSIYEEEEKIKSDSVK